MASYHLHVSCSLINNPADCQQAHVVQSTSPLVSSFPSFRKRRKYPPSPLLTACVLTPDSRPPRVLVQPHLFLPRCLQAPAVNGISHAFPAFLLCPKTCTPIAVPLIWTGKFKAISVMAPLTLEHRPPSIITSFHFPCQLSWLAYRPAATILGEHKPAQQGC